MPTYNWSAIYLGNTADMDPDDADSTAENASLLLGTYGSNADPLKDQVVDVTANDADGDTDINYDDPSETLVIDGVSNTLDSGAVFNATITYMDGTTATITAVVLQTSNGDLYLAPEMADNADKAAMEAGPIRSLSLDSVNTDTTSIGANRQSTNFVCYVNGTLITTPHGPVPVEDLQIGDAVCVHDGGTHAIRWIGSRKISLSRQITDIGARPVRIAANALGPGLPQATLMVSQQHRMLLSSPVAKRMFGNDEVLVAAKKLVGQPGIAIAAPTKPLRYIHFAFDAHHVVMANGALSESLYLGEEACKILARDGDALMPDAADGGAVFAVKMAPARQIITGPRLRRFLSRLEQRSLRHPCASGSHSAYRQCAPWVSRPITENNAEYQITRSAFAAAEPDGLRIDSMVQPKGVDRSQRRDGSA